jgi:hypothetical protein
MDHIFRSTYMRPRVSIRIRHIHVTFDVRAYTLKHFFYVLPAETPQKLMLHP